MYNNNYYSYNNIYTMYVPVIPYLLSSQTTKEYFGDKVIETVKKTYIMIHPITGVGILIQLKNQLQHQEELLSKNICLLLIFLLLVAERTAPMMKLEWEDNSPPIIL